MAGGFRFLLAIKLGLIPIEGFVTQGKSFERNCKYYIKSTFLAGALTGPDTIAC